MTRNTAAYDPGYLARFTAAITSTTPEFDPATNPIGHALAIELFAPPPTAALGIPVVEVAEIVVAAEPRYASWPELAIEARARAMAERARVLSEVVARPDPGSGVLGELVEMPAAVEPEWFGATTEPDEDPDVDIDELDEQVRMAG